jgi:hypothetical protein
MVEENRRYEVPGELKAIVLSRNFSENSHRASVMRLWAPINKGDISSEMAHSPLGISFEMSPMLHHYQNFGIGMNFHFRPFHPFRLGAGLKYIQHKDSRDELDLGFGIQGTAKVHILSSHKLAFSGLLALDLDFYFKKDDNNQRCNTLVPSLSPGLQTEYMLSQSTSLVLTTKYGFGGTSISWQVKGKDKGANTAQWRSSEPEIDMSDIRVSLSYKVLLF